MYIPFDHQVKTIIINWLLTLDCDLQKRISDKHVHTNIYEELFVK